jgi:hypothetical protein
MPKYIIRIISEKADIKPIQQGGDNMLHAFELATQHKRLNIPSGEECEIRITHKASKLTLAFRATYE